MKKIIAFLIILACIPTIAFSAAQDRISAPVPGFHMTVPVDYTFKISGDEKEWVLLDVAANGDCFILANDYYGTYQFDPDLTAKFDPEDENNIAYFLNNAFLTVGNTADGKIMKIPDAMQQYIDKNREWPTEAGRGTSVIPKDYSVKAGVAILSQTEWIKYTPKFTDNLGSSTWGSWLRTARGKGVQQDAYMLCAQTAGAYGTTNAASADKYELVRPCFYLKKDFFSNVKLDVTSIGLAVNTMLKKNFTTGDLQKLYQKNELDIVFKNLPPAATSVYAIGIQHEGRVMKGAYKYEDAEGDVEGNSKFRWLKSTNGGSPVVIIGATDIEYVIKAEDVDCNLIFEVTPANATGTGVPMVSAESKTIIENQPPTILRSRIIGEPYTDEILIGYYDYKDLNEDMESTSIYKWYRAADVKGEKVLIEGAVNREYKPTADDVGQYIFFEVTPKSIGSVKNVGKPFVTAPVGVIKALNYTKNTVEKNGNTLKGSYEFVKNEEANTEVTQKWFIASTAKGQYSEMVGENSNTYTVKPEDSGKYIAFGTMVAGGRETLSEPVAIEGASIGLSSLVAQVGSLDFSLTGGSAKLNVSDADFVNSMAMTVTYDPAKTELTDVTGALASEIKFIYGAAGKKTIHLSMGANKAGLRGDAELATLIFKSGGSDVKIENIKLYKMGDAGKLTSSIYDKITVSQ